MPTKSKLPGLEPIHYVDVANPTMMKKWLSNKNAHRAWEDAAESASSDNEDVIQLQDLTYKPSSYEKLDPLLVGRAMKEYVDLVINDWTEDSTDYSAKVLVASLPLFVEMSKSLPHVNPSEEYKVAFRGTGISDRALKQFIKNNQKPGDWVQTNVEGKKYMAYKGPKKRMFTYKPHRQVQSWSTSEKAASNFGSHILATPLDLSFFFDPTFMNQYGFKWENETIHFGKEPMKVALLVDIDVYEKLADRMKNPSASKKKDDPANATFESDYEQYMANKYTDGDKLMFKIDQEIQDKMDTYDWYEDNKDTLMKQKKALGPAGFKKKYKEILKKLEAMPVKENNTTIQETVDVQDEEGTLTMPL